MNTEHENAVLDSYVQADAPGWEGMFKSFSACLKSMLAAGDAGGAADWARRAVSVDLDYASHLMLRKIILQAPAQGRDPLRIAVLGGPTTTQLVWLIQNFLQAQGIGAEIFEGEYGLFRQSVLMPDSKLDTFCPQFVFFATNARDLPEIPSQGMAREEFEQWVDKEVVQWQHVWRVANDRWGSQIIQNLFEVPPWGCSDIISTGSACRRNDL